MLHCCDSYVVIQLPSVGHSFTSISVVCGLVFDPLACSFASHPYTIISPAASQCHWYGYSISPTLYLTQGCLFSPSHTSLFLFFLFFPSKISTDLYSQLPGFFLFNLCFSTKGFPKLNAALLVVLASAQSQDYLDHPTPSVSSLYLPPQ